MQPIDKIVFGDNQFFGINHMSQEKAQQLAELFFDISEIFRVYDIAYSSGIRAIMLNSNDRAREICDHFRNNKSRFHDVSWYPSIPYPHKYANLVSEKGIMPAISEVLLRQNTVGGMISMVAKGSAAVIWKDPVKIMQMLIDLEMRMFKGLNVKVVFLQNVITDLILGFGVREIFEEYASYIRKKYHALPGFITQNLPILKARLEEWDIKEVVICSSFNKIGYLMSPGIDKYISAIETNNPDHYQLMAMSTLASGAIPAREAFEFINRFPLQSVVFGASSRSHIEASVNLLKTPTESVPHGY